MSHGERKEKETEDSSQNNHTNGLMKIRIKVKNLYKQFGFKALYAPGKDRGMRGETWSHTNSRTTACLQTPEPCCAGIPRENQMNHFEELSDILRKPLMFSSSAIPMPINQNQAFGNVLSQLGPVP